MSKILKFKRGTTAKNNAYVGSDGELTVDTNKKTVVVHDGVTAGGSILATEQSASNPNNIVQDSAHRFVTDTDKTNWNGKINATEKAVANGVATLDLNCKVVLTQIPDSVLGQLEYMGVYSFSSGMPTATQKGQYWIASTDGNGYITGDWAVWNGTSFDKVDNTDAVATVAGRTGNVVLAKNDVGLNNVDNTSDANKPVSTAQQTALNLKANIASPTFTGTVVLPSTTSIGTVTSTELGYLDGVTSSVQTQMNLKAPLTSPALTGTPTAPTATAGTNTTQIASTAFVAAGLGLKADVAQTMYIGTTALPINRASAALTLSGVDIDGNTATATKLQTTRSISLTGDVTGTVNFDGSEDVDINVTVADDSHNHTELIAIDDRDVKPNSTGINGKKAIKAFFTTKEGLTGVEGIDYQDLIVIDTYTDTSGGLINALAIDKSTKQITHYQASQKDSSWGAGRNLAYTDSSIIGNAATATKLSSNRTFALTGDVTGTISSDLSAGLSISTTIAPNSVALGTDTTGNYVAGLTQGTGITVSGTAGEGWSPTVAITNVGTAGTYTKVTTNAQGQVTSGTSLSASDIPVLDASKITTGTIDAARLPAYVDDVLEFTNLASFPTTGETGKIYVALDTNKTYRWSGSVYIYITSGAVDSVAGKTGVVTLVKGDVGLGSVDNTADSVKNVLSATKLTTARTIGITGDLTWTSPSFDGSGNVTAAGTLANSGITAGTYTKVTVDAKGRATAGAQMTLEDIPDSTFKKSVRCATTANLAATYASNVLTMGAVGVTTIDGITVALNDRILIKDQTTALQNGIYRVSTLGTASVATVFTRTTDADITSEISSALVAVDSGTANGGRLFDNDLKTTDTLGTTAVNFNLIVDTGFASTVVGSTPGTAAIGTSTNYARADHVHPIDTSRAPISSPTFTGTVTTPALTISGTGTITTRISGVASNLTALGAGTTNPIHIPMINVGTTYGFIPMLSTRVLSASGHINNNSIGSYRPEYNWTNSGVYIATGGNDNFPTEAFLFQNGRKISSTGGEISLVGNADTATTLQTARNINGVSFNGSANIDIANLVGNNYIAPGSEKPNNSVFGAGKFRYQMLSSSNLGAGTVGTWNDVLWTSSYTGSDVKGSNAIIMSKEQDWIGFARQAYDAASWGTVREILHTGNMDTKIGTLAEFTAALG